MTALKIALRYLVAPKRHNVVNIIAFIAIAGIAVATTAMVVVLSVFNGFADIAAQHMTNYDPPLEVTRADGRAIANADTYQKLQAYLQPDFLENLLKNYVRRDFLKG